jgi:hypothetical protein
MRNSDQCDGVLSARAARMWLLVIVPLALVLGVQTISWAVPKVWTHGETLTADDLNRNFGSIDEGIATLGQLHAWAVCGFLDDLRSGVRACEMRDYPVDQYEYGFKYNGTEVHVADCVDWNVGLRIVNRYPYLVDSDDPTNGAMQLGGTIFYTGTDALDDDTPRGCPVGQWRHHYWKITSGNVLLFDSNGCGNEPIYCRRR